MPDQKKDKTERTDKEQERLEDLDPAKDPTGGARKTSGGPAPDSDIAGGGGQHD